MSNQNSTEWKRIHNESTIVDIHAHPSLKVSLFRRMLKFRYPAARGFNPFHLRTDFPKLTDGGVDVLWSSVYTPERGIMDECRFVKIMRFILPFTWWKVFRRPYFKITNEMLDEMEIQVNKSINKKTKTPFAKMIYSLKELNDHLALPEKNRPIGSHSALFRS